jgi:putative peptidoglycan lipid II flippase
MKVPFIQHVVSTFGITIVQQFVGLARHVLIAAYFGLSRDFDGYLVIYSVATIFIFNLSGAFDTAVVSRLVQVREREGESAFWRSSNRILLQTLAGGGLFSLALFALIQLLLPIVAAGFNPSERAEVARLAFYFLPWTAIVIPYYAISAHLKALWQFHWVFGAEIVTMIVSILFLWFWHDSIICLPLAYATGYFFAFIILLARRGVLRTDRSAKSSAMIGVMANQYLASQMGSAGGIVDRYFQSFLAPGGISALGYVGQIVNNLSSLMTFREIYIAPLASEQGRSERVQRILKGILLISVPCTCFVVTYAEPIIRVLFQRGQFTPEAAILTGSLLRIMGLSLVISSVLAPMERLFLIVNRMSYSYLRYAVSLAATALFQYLLVFRLGWDVYGIAWASIANSAVVTFAVAILVRRCGITLDWQSVFVTATFALAVAAAAIAISLPISNRFQGLPALMVGGALYCTVVAAGYFTVRNRIRLIIGQAPPGG